MPVISQTHTLIKQICVNDAIIANINDGEILLNSIMTNYVFEFVPRPWIVVI